MLLELINASFNVKGKVLLNDVSLRISRNDKIGIVGRNGCGKSTLLELLSGTKPLTAGTLKQDKKTRVMLVKQELPTDDKSVLEWLRSVDQDLVTLQSKLDSSKLDQFGDIADQMAEIDEERYEKLAPRVLSGLGLTPEEFNQPMKNLSGGFCMRVSLAAALIQQPDLLLLDEPTNHLDLISSLWLTDFLKTYPKAYAVVSHDTDFLNQVTNKTWSMQTGKLSTWSGNYDIYVREAEFKKTLDSKNNDSITKKQEHFQVFIDRFGSHSSTAGLAQSRKKTISKLEQKRIEILPEEKEIPITFPEVALLDNPIINLKGISAGYTDRMVLNNITFSINQDSRIGLLGKNGQGKSTFAKLIADRLESKSSDDGLITRRSGLRIGYFSQNQADELKSELSVYEQLKVASGMVDDAKLRSHLAHFGFDHTKASCKIGKLSGGEKSRLFFAIIAAQQPHLIILDEPTNHLDIPTREALIKAINEYSGAIMLISHDWHLLSRTMKEYALVDNGRVMPYAKGLEHYKKSALTKIRESLSHPVVAEDKSVVTSTTLFKKGHVSSSSNVVERAHPSPK